MDQEDGSLVINDFGGLGTATTVGEHIMRILIVGLCLALIGCDDPPHMFKPGDIVHVKLDHRAGMIVDAEHWDDGTICYQVRFAGAQMITDTHVLSDDGPITAVPYSLQRIREIELER